MRKITAGSIGISIALGLVSNSFASAPPQSKTGINPGTVNPANVINTLDQTLPGAQEPQQGSLSVQANPQQIQHAKDVSNTIVLKQVQLRGVTHSVPANVTAIYQKMIGQSMSFKDIQKMAADMEQTYRNDGFILVQVILPPQEITAAAGVVKLQIIEGQIQNVIFVGDDPQAARAQLERYAEQIEVEDPISYASIDRFLVLANQLPGIDVSATLVPSKTVVGGSDLVVQVDQTKASGFMNFNNRGTSYIGPGQMSVGGSLYDILGADSLSLTEATSLSNPQQLHYTDISYDIVVGPYATEINPWVSVAQTTPGGSLSVFDMYGESTKYNLSVNQPIYVSTPQKLTFQSSLYHLNSFNSIFDSEQLYDDNVTGLTLGLDYQGIFWQTYNDINLSSTFGLPILGTPQTLSNPSIAGATTQFVRFNLSTNDIHYFTQRISMALGSQFQVTPNSLVSSEQISYGGPVFGQAYIPNVISGDSGAMGSIALRYDLPAPGWINLLQPQIFYDVGTVTLNNPPLGFADGATGQSAGFGLNVQAWNHWQMGLEFAKPLRITQTSGVPMGWQTFFNITGLF